VLLKYAKVDGIPVDDLIDDDVKLPLDRSRRAKGKKN